MESCNPSGTSNGNDTQFIRSLQKEFRGASHNKDGEN